MKIKAGPYTIDKRRGKWTVTHPDKLGSITIYGNGHIVETFYAIPDWGSTEEEAFNYRGETYFLSEFMVIGKHAPEWMREFDGHHGDSFFSGILIKWSDDTWDEGWKVYTYIG